MKNFYSQKQIKQFLLKIKDEFVKKNHLNVVLSFKDINNGVYAETELYINDEEQKILSVINYNLKAIYFPTKEQYIYELLVTLYHELYHCLINEQYYNQDNFSITAFQKYLLDLSDIDDYQGFYDANYDLIKEEWKAQIYSMYMAYFYLKNNIPNFSFSKIKYIKKEFTNCQNHLKECNYLWENNSLYDTSTMYAKLLTKIDIESSSKCLNLSKIINVEKQKIKTLEEIENDYQSYLLK